MKHLHAIFKDDLADESNLFVEDGLIFIRSRYWTPADVVDMAGKVGKTNDVFDELFSDWFRERVDRQVELADEILERYDQTDRFLRLTEAHRAGSVIPFVGAGLSIPSGYPGWTSFLRKQRRQTGILEDELEEMLQNGHFEEAAQKIANEQGVAFNEAVDSTFGCTRDLSGAVELLPYVFTGSVVTTNFDNVLERSFKNSDREFNDRLSGCDSQAIRRKLAAGDRFLLMLHGAAETSRGRILTLAEYEAHYVGGNTIDKTIRALCDNRNLLFLGCSLSVDRTLSSIREYVGKEGHDNLPKHYALLEVPESEEMRLRRQRELSECHVYPIWFPKDTHNEAIEALLTKLLASTRS